jgi:NAD-dependent deacetylase
MNKKNIVIFSGAGLSRESGSPTFRDSVSGLWHNFRIEDVASSEGWQRNPEVVLKFYQHRLENIRSCEPNAGHLAIAQLEKRFNVLNITQNIDDLLERAGASQVRHLHGSMRYRKCEWHHSIVPASGDPRFACDYRIEQETAVSLGEKCIRCGGQMRPDVVWFGEAVNMQWDALEQLALETDVFIGVGTSARVEPAASLLGVFSQAKERFFVDPDPPLGLQGFTILKGTAGQQLPALVNSLTERLSA